MVDEDTSDSNEPSSWLTHHWVVAGIVSASARFVPIPFVDDIIQQRCRRYAVSQTLSAHGKSDQLHHLKSYYGSADGCVAGCLGIIAKAPMKLLLFPIRKFVALFTSIRGVPLEIMRTVLLGRTLDRYLRQGATLDAAQAEAMRISFDAAFARMDLHAVRAAIKDSLRGIQGWKSSSVQAARTLLEQTDEPDESIDAPSQVEQGAQQIEDVLARPETLALFEEFDRRFDMEMGAKAP